MNEIGLLALLVAGIWIWHSGAKAKEVATECVKLALGETGMQLLDGTIYMKKIWPTRMSSGVVGLLRFYNFEYTSNGADRYQGLIVMAGDRMEYLQIEKDGQSIITTGEDIS